MSTDPALIAAIAKNATYIATLDAAAKKKKLTPKQQASRASAVAKFDAYVLRYAASLGGETPAPTGPTPPTSGDAAARSKAWNHSEAADNVNAVLERLNDQGVTDLAAQIAALGPGLAGQAIALGKFGSPDHPAGDVDFALAEPWGGYWAVESGFDETGYWAQAWNGSKKAGDRVVDPVSAPDVQEVGMANGLNSRIDGPA